MNKERFERTTAQSMEVELVTQVRSCRDCEFFWPGDGTPQPYGPYPCFDFTENTPSGNTPPSGDSQLWPWLRGSTVNEGFPHPEIMDGCRKAPIMTIGINPNLTAFAPGPQGASWCYPLFSDAGGTNGDLKYAWYYRNRPLYQECFCLDFMKKFLLKEGQIIAEKGGFVKSAWRESDAPSYTLEVVYDDTPQVEATEIPLKWELGTPRYVLLVNPYEPENRFESGDILAARLKVPADQQVEINQQLIGYYEQMNPVLALFENFLEQKGAKGISLKVGEDVAQLDMVACASPHWNPAFLGGTEEGEQKIIDNCVVKTGWAMKQFLHTRPAILFIVGESSFSMFRKAFGHWIDSPHPLPERPVDYAFTLLRDTVDHTVRFQFDDEANNLSFSMETRIVVTPHFSYNDNFYRQFRMDQDDWKDFQSGYPDCFEYLSQADGVSLKIPEEKDEYMSVELRENSSKTLSILKREYQKAFSRLKEKYYDPHGMMNSVLESLYNQGKLSCGSREGQPFLIRSEEGCRFCTDNGKWSFPGGCPYGKTAESEPDYTLLEAVTAEIIRQGKPSST